MALLPSMKIYMLFHLFLTDGHISIHLLPLQPSLILQAGLGVLLDVCIVPDAFLYLALTMPCSNCTFACLSLPLHYELLGSLQGVKHLVNVCLVN